MGGRSKSQGRLGQFVTTPVAGENVQAFVPSPLPPVPPIDMSVIVKILSEATLALGRLDGIAATVPDTQLFLYMYVRKEAVLSSQIEGTQSSLSELLLFENDVAPSVPIDDVKEVSNYVAAQAHGFQRLRSGFPLSLRLLREIHELLLASGRGATKEPGHFRRSQNWIGGNRPGNATFVPPPPDALTDCLDNFEKFLHADDPHMPPLIKAGIAHLQFETIHPFLDGNGRLGRLLITLLLYTEGVISEPLLYLSLYLKKNRETYYDLLQETRENGDWETWLEFFLVGVRDTALAGFDTANALRDMFMSDAAKILSLGKAAASATKVHRLLMSRPIVSAKIVADELGISRPTAVNALTNLGELGIVQEFSGKKRDRNFAYDAYIKVLSEGTEPLG